MKSYQRHCSIKDQVGWQEPRHLPPHLRLPLGPSNKPLPTAVKALMKSFLTEMMGSRNYYPH